MTTIIEDIEQVVKQLIADGVHPEKCYLHPTVQKNIEKLKNSSFYKLSDIEKGLDTVRDLRKRVLLR